MTDATKKFLTERFGFTADELTANTALFDAREDKITAVATADAEIATTRAELDKLNTKLNKEMAEWAEADAVGSTKVKELQDKLDATQLRAFQVEQKLTTLATEHGVDVKTLLPSGEPPVDPKKVEPAPINLEGYVKADQLGQVANVILNLMPELQALDREHFDLTGERLDTRPIVQELQTRAGTKGNTKPVNARAIWEEQHQIPAKRDARAATDLQKKLDAAREEGFKAATTQASLPGQHTPGKSASVVFNTPSAQGASKIQRPAGPSRVAAAASALANHTYAGGKKPAAA